MVRKIDLAEEYSLKAIETSARTGVNISKRAIAMRLYADYPDIFSSVENARTTVRDVFGCRGTKNKNCKLSVKESLSLLPEPVKELDTTPFIMPKAQNKVLVMNDIHGRFYDKKAFETAINYGIKKGCNTVFINGDFLDNYAQSKFDKNPLVSKLMEEREWGQETLSLLQDIFGYVVLKEGNHDKRMKLWVERAFASSPEYMDLMGGYKEFLFFDGCTVQFVEDHKVVKMGDLNAIHGHEIYGGGGINVARNRFLKTFTNLISGHSHLAKSDVFTSLNGDVYGSYSVGCLCNLSPAYNPVNQWNHGFAEVEIDGNEFEVNNKIVLNGKAYSI